MSTQVAVHQQHDLRSRQRADGKDHHARHDNIDRRADAAEPRNEQGYYPEIGAMPARECLRSQGRVGKPSHVRSISSPIQTIRSEETKIKKDAAECRQPET